MLLGKPSDKWNESTDKHDKHIVTRIGGSWCNGRVGLEGPHGFGPESKPLRAPSKAGLLGGSCFVVSLADYSFSDTICAMNGTGDSHTIAAAQALR